MAKPKVTEREVRLARSFLRAMHSNEVNTYLLLAVIAWTRAMTKAHDPFWKRLSGYSAVSAGARLAAKLQDRAKRDPKDYRAMLRRLRGKSTKASDEAAQAADFLRSIELSPWDRKHYGYVAGTEAHVEHIWHQTSQAGSGYYEDVWVPATDEKDPLWNAYARLTNNPNIPNKWFVDTTRTTTKHTKVIPPRPSQPRSLAHTLPTTDYILPYASQHFYEARPHFGANLLLDD